MTEPLLYSVNDEGDELLNGEVFDRVLETQVLCEQWPRHYVAVRSHSSLGRPRSAPEAITPRLEAVAVGVPCGDGARIGERYHRSVGDGSTAVLGQLSGRETVLVLFCDRGQARSLKRRITLSAPPRCFVDGPALF